ncbi:MAG TPA: hypothetical protein VMN78_06525 [Longimicrobiales bacterium]|nr:hypothetical protein [Longimicrobiales bacterium]
MSRRPALGAGLLLGLVLGACDQELPTEVGGELLPEAALRTYEILLEDAAFLSADTLLRGFGTSQSSLVLLVAEDYRDALDAHSLVQFGDFPTEVTFIDSLGTQTDTIERFAGGRIIVRMDTVALALDTLGTDTTIAIEMYEVAEPFDARTATWTARSVESGDTAFWTTPGGTVGALIGSATWTRSDTVALDTMVFTIDSATVDRWAAGAEPPAVLLRTATPGARAQLFVPRLEATAWLMGADTSRTVSVVVQAQTYLIDPPPPEPAAELRLGGRSAWRSFLTFTDRLDTVRVACPDEPVGCSFRLGEATVNRAELRLRALPVAEVYRPRGNLVMEARPLLGGDVPLERAPLADTTGVAFGITPAHFDEATDSVVTISVTRFLRELLNAGTDTILSERNRTVALLTVPEPLPFGIVRFGSSETAGAEPVLRLIVTLPPREEDD